MQPSYQYFIILSQNRNLTASLQFGYSAVPQMQISAEIPNVSPLPQPQPIHCPLNLDTLPATRKTGERSSGTLRLPSPPYCSVLYLQPAVSCLLALLCLDADAAILTHLSAITARYSSITINSLPKAHRTVFQNCAPYCYTRTVNTIPLSDVQDGSCHHCTLPLSAGTSKQIERLLPRTLCSSPLLPRTLCSSPLLPRTALSVHTAACLHPANRIMELCRAKLTVNSCLTLRSPN